MKTKKLKPVYLLFLVIPLLFYFLAGKAPENISKQHNDYFFFSVRTTAPATISLYSDKDSLTSWEVNSAGYKYLDYVGNLNDNNGIKLKIRKLNVNDTVSFLLFNLSRKDSIYTLHESGEPYCDVKNARLCENGEMLTAVVQSHEKPVDVQLQKSSTWEKSNVNHNFNLLIIVGLIITFIFILFFAPPARYFTFICALDILLMVLFYFMNRDFQCQVTLSTKSQVKSFQTFYNNNPCFVGDKVFTSLNGGQSFSAPVDLSTNNYLRCDADGSAQLEDVHFSIKAGLISSACDLKSALRNGMQMNDLFLRNDKFYVTGDDPHFVFTSNYFTSRVQWLIFIRKNLFLFISLLIFILLTVLHRWTAGLCLNHLHPAYLFFLVIPVIYYSLVPIRGTAKAKSQKEHIYFSVRTSKPSVIELKDPVKTIDSWEVNSAGYKYLQYSGDSIESAAAYTISIKSPAPDDTISILSINIFKNDQVFSLDKENGSSCRITDAGIISGGGVIDAVVQTPGKPVNIVLPFLNSWKRSTPEGDIRIYIILLFIFLFLLIHVLGPITKYLMSICTMASIVMIILFLINQHLHSHVAVQTGSPVRSANFFYNDNPCFVENKRSSINDWASFFKTDIPFSENNYLRCGINNDTRELNSLQVIVKDGFLHHNMELCDIPHDKMLFNDINYHNNSFIITGNDPYFCLTSNYFVTQLQWLMVLKNNLFLFISIFIFIIYLAMHKLARENYK